jgi:hypothetical protein
VTKPTIIVKEGLEKDYLNVVRCKLPNALDKSLGKNKYDKKTSEN